MIHNIQLYTEETTYSTSNNTKKHTGLGAAAVLDHIKNAVAALTGEHLKESSSAGSDPWNVNWPVDPIDGDFDYGFDGSISGNPFGVGSGDMDKLLKMLEAMKNGNFAGVDLSKILEFLTNLYNSGEIDNNPLIKSFFAQADMQELMKDIINTMVMLAYAKAASGGATPAQADAAVQSFYNQLMASPFGKLAGDNPMMAQLQADMQNDLGSSGVFYSEFWDSATHSIFQLPANFSGDGQPVILSGDDGYEIFARFTYQTYQTDCFQQPGWSLTNEAFYMLILGLLAKTKDPGIALQMVSIEFGIGLDNQDQSSLKGYTYTSNFLSKQRNEMQQLLNEYQDPTYFTGADGAAHAQAWMTKMRELYYNTEFNPYTQDLSGSMLSSYQTVFNLTAPYETQTLGQLFASGNFGELRAALNVLSQGASWANPPVPPSTVITDQMQNMTKAVSDRSSSLQTEMSALSNQDNTIVNTMKMLLQSFTQLGQTIVNHSGPGTS